MSKFQVGDRATPITTDSHPHISKACSYTIISVDRHFVEITDDIGVTSWWNKDWFTKIEGVKLDTEALQHSYKALEDSLVSLQQQVDRIEAERVKIVGQLKEMGICPNPRHSCKGTRSCFFIKSLKTTLIPLNGRKVILLSVLMTQGGTETLCLVGFIRLGTLAEFVELSCSMSTV